MSEIQLLIIEDDAIIAEDISAICSHFGGYQVVETAHTAGEALIAIDNHPVDLVLLDINLEDEIDGIDIAETLQENSTPFIYITSYADNETISRAKRTKPIGYIVKPFSKNQLLSTIEISLYNYSQMQIPGGLDIEVLNAQLFNSISEREFSILLHVYNGKTNKQMAGLEFLSVNTIKYHIKQLYIKLNATSRSSLLARVRDLQQNKQ